jgi:hypothetical protein
MGIVSKTYTFSAGAVVLAAEHNSNFDTIYNEFNGNISNANIKVGAAIADTKLDTITTASKVNLTALAVTGQQPGDIIYYDGSVWARLGTGAAGTTLTINAGTTAPEWA